MRNLSKILIQLLSIFLVLIIHSVYAQSCKLPLSFTKTFNKLNLGTKYELTSYLKPCFLAEDFNGDGIKEIAVTINDKKTHKKGILLMDSKNENYKIFGAGVSFGDTNHSDNFSWVKGWKIYKRENAYETLFDTEGDLTGSKQIKLNHHALYIYDTIDGEPYAGGLIYWNGIKYLWIHQGE